MRRSPLPARKTPLARTKKPISRSKKCLAWVKRDGTIIPLDGPVRKRPNAKRPGPARRVSVVRDRKYMDWLKEKGCVACCVRWWNNTDLSAGSDPAHTAKTNGARSKGPDSSCIPLCRYHHDEMDGHMNMAITTKEKFALAYGLDLAAIAAEHYERFKLEEKTK